MKIRISRFDADLDRIAPVLLQLREQFSREALIEQIAAQRKRGYEIAFGESSGRVLCVAGFWVGLKLAWGKHLYVDDLVTAQSHRSAGAGTAMIRWLKAYARDQGCRELHLDSGVQRFAAHRFYLREGFDISSHHFVLKDLDDRG